MNIVLIIDKGYKPSSYIISALVHFFSVNYTDHSGLTMTVLLTMLMVMKCLAREMIAGWTN